MAEQAKSVAAAVGHNSYAVTRFNAVKHAVLSRYTVLPWEDESEYGELLVTKASASVPMIVP